MYIPAWGSPEELKSFHPSNDEVRIWPCNGGVAGRIPDTETLRPKAFWECRSLLRLTIPDSVTQIGYSAFQDCSSLTRLTLSQSLTTIGTSAFAGCSSLTSLAIPESITAIGAGAFSNCSSLTSLIIPESVTAIEASTFLNALWQVWRCHRAWQPAKAQYHIVPSLQLFENFRNPWLCEIGHPRGIVDESKGRSFACCNK